MDNLELITKPTSQHAKDTSIYTLSVPIIASDVEKFDVPVEWVGKTIDLAPQVCGRYTNETGNVLTSRLKAWQRDITEGKEARDIRSVAGFEPFEKHRGHQPKKKQVMGEEIRATLINRKLREW